MNQSRKSKKSQSNQDGRRKPGRVYSFLVVLAASVLLTLAFVPNVDGEFTSSIVLSGAYEIEGAVYDYWMTKIEQERLIEAAKATGIWNRESDQDAQLEDLRQNVAIRITTRTGSDAELQFTHPNRQLTIDYLDRLGEGIVKADESHRTIATSTNSLDNVFGDHPTAPIGIQHSQPQVVEHHTVLPAHWLMATIAIGLTVAFGTVWFADPNDRNDVFDSEEQIEKTLGAPVLGSVFPTREKSESHENRFSTRMAHRFVRVCEYGLWLFVGFMTYCAMTDAKFIGKIVANPATAYVEACNQHLH